MNTRSIFLSIVAFFTLASCHKIDTTPSGSDITVNFEAKYGSDHLIKYHDYTFNGYPLQFNRFTLFISDLTLFNATQSVTLTEAEFLNFTPDNASSDNTPILNYTYKAIPDGDYTGIRIGYGVKPVNNNKIPNDFAAGSPLANAGEYWASWKSYIFSKIEGQADSDNNKVYDTFLTYHCGGNAVYKYETINTPVHIGYGSKLNIAFDLQKILTTSTGQPFNIIADPVTSNNKDSVRVSNILMGNFAKATSVSQ